MTTGVGEMSDERREVIVAVTDECLPGLFTTPSGRPWEFVRGLPDGATLVGVRPEPFDGRTLFKFRHESFAVVLPGSHAPFTDVIVWRREVGHCAWCADPSNPDPQFHPGGSPEHQPQILRHVKG